MRISQLFFRLLPLSTALIVASGCTTKALWNGNAFENWNEPAGNPNLRLFEGCQQTNVLVVYTEYSERSDAFHTRAYWLDQNQQRLEHSRRPYFVGTNAASGLLAVPVFEKSPEGTNAPPIYAIFETNRQEFTLYSSTAPGISHDLPVYNDGKGKFEKAAATPIAITADFTIVGGFLGYCYLQGMANTGGNISWH